MSKRVEWIDIGKGIAMLCVIYGHVVIDKSATSAIAVHSFHMPLFFVFAGYTFNLKSMKEVLQQSVRRLLYPYVLLFLLQSIPLFLRSESITPEFLSSQALRFFFASAVRSPNYGIGSVGILWFLVVLFVSRIVLNLVLMVRAGDSGSTLKYLIVLGGSSCVGILIGCHYFLPLSLDVVPLATSYMFAGYLAKEHGIMSKSLHPMAVVSLAAVWLLAIRSGWYSIGERAYGSLPISILGSVAGTLLVAKLCQKLEAFGGILKRPLVFIGANSLLVFAAHAIEMGYVKWASYPLIKVSGHSLLIQLCVRYLFIILVVLLMKSLITPFWPRKDKPTH